MPAGVAHTLIASILHGGYVPGEHKTNSRDALEAASLLDPWLRSALDASWRARRLDNSTAFLDVGVGVTRKNLSIHDIGSNEASANAPMGSNGFECIAPLTCTCKRPQHLHENSTFFDIGSGMMRKGTVSSFAAEKNMPPKEEEDKTPEQVVKMYPETEYPETCQEWKEQGECENNPGSMIDGGLCTYTCRCFDLNPACPQMAAEGRCRTDHTGLAQECRKSCNWCLMHQDALPPGVSSKAH